MLHQKIKRLRQSNFFSQQFVADFLQMSRPTYIAIEKEKRDLTVPELTKISELFGVSLEVLLNKEEDKRIPKKHTTTDLRKYKDIILYLLNKVGAQPNIGLTTIYKLLFYIDLNWNKKHNKTLTGSTYIKNYFGPTPVEFIKAISEMKKSTEVLEIDSKYYQREQKRFLPLRPIRTLHLKKNERAHIDKTVNSLASYNASELTKRSHAESFWSLYKYGEVINFNQMSVNPKAR